MRFARCMIAGLGLSIVLSAAPMLFRSIAAATPPQNPSQHGPQQASSQSSKKVANPLNEWLDEAQRDIDKNDFAAAIEPLQKVIKEEPDIAFPHFQLAYVFTALQKTDEARAEYERVIAIDPKMAAAYLNLGILLLDKDPAAAVAPLKKAVEILRRKATCAYCWAWRRSGATIWPELRKRSKRRENWIRAMRKLRNAWAPCT